MLSFTPPFWPPMRWMFATPHRNLARSAAQAFRNCTSAPAKEVHLAELDAIVPQDVIRSRGVEEEIRQHVVHEIRLALHAFGAAARLPGDRFVFGPIELLRLESLELNEGLAQARAEFRKRTFVVLVHRNVCPCDTSRTADRGVRRELYLPRERKHVGEQARVEQNRGINLSRFRMGRTLLEYRNEIVQHADKRGNGGLIHRCLHWQGPLVASALFYRARSARTSQMAGRNSCLQPPPQASLTR